MAGAAVRSNYSHWGVYGRGWYAQYPGAWLAAGWAAGTAWDACTWNSASAYCGYSDAPPAYYDYGNNVTYEDGNVYVNGDDAGTSEQYYDQANQIAAAGAAAAASPESDWLPLGVFAFTKPDETASDITIQLAVSKEGVIRGNYTDSTTKQNQVVQGSIDKQTHAMDTERWICDLIEFDRAVGLCTDFAKSRGDTLVIVTADHECGGVAVIGASRVTDEKLAELAAGGGGAGTLRDKVVGAGESAGFPRYRIGADGYPETTDIDHRLLIGYAAGADRYEDWRTNPKPMDPMKRDVEGGYRISGISPGRSASHTAADVGLSAAGVGSRLFTGVMDNTDVFFKIMQVSLGGVPKLEDE